MEVDGQTYIFFGILIFIFQLLGIFTTISALLRKQNSQSAIAWALSCLTLPYIAVPAYWILGRDRFRGYVSSFRASYGELEDISRELARYIPEYSSISKEDLQTCDLFQDLARSPFTSQNNVELFINGTLYFEEVFRQIASAKEYVLVQFFIIRADEIGRRLHAALAAKAAEGVRVYLLYDRIGSQGVSKKFIRDMRADGIEVRAFTTSTRALSTRMQINFRNHRKAVIVDGVWAGTGGANLGVEYCGKVARFGEWRDTMVGISGPAVLELQLAFAQDWFFVNRSVPELRWHPEPSTKSSKAVLAIPTGPADGIPRCSLMLIQTIQAAQDRLWITSPYFVPDEPTVRALQLAALRGVDVRIILPQKPDHKMVYWASFTYLAELERTGVSFYRYTKGFLHQKVILVDDKLSLIGSCNMDNRSLYLNFEVMVLTANRQFAELVENMLRDDFEHCVPAGHADYIRRGFLFRIIARISRLFSPIL